jgi:hypothetical protein
VATSLQISASMRRMSFTRAPRWAPRPSKFSRGQAYTQAETSKRLGIKQPEVSALMRARFHRFSHKRLIGFLNKLNLKVTIQISRRQGSEPFQQVSIAP